MKSIIIFLFLISHYSLYSQGNCLIYPEGSAGRKACELGYKALEYPQGSKESQLIFDSVIAINPNYAWAYFEKSVPYLKRGFLYEGLQILNKAIELEPVNYLCYRASWYWQYKNYDLCIQDLEMYYALPNAYLQYTPGGEMNMKIVLGLAYAKNKNYQKAIKKIESYISAYKSENDIGLFDYHTLGLLYVYNKQYNKAIEAFEKQFTINNNIADSYYYLGLAYKGNSNIDAANIQFEKALSLLNNKNRHRIYIGYPVNKNDVNKEFEKR
jgi:tetratricopeptide (TPR) repeat protein